MQVYEKELQAVIHALLSWKHYLLGADFVVQTDHQTLRYFLTQEKLSEKHMRWANILSMFHFQIVHVGGKKNVVADALSRKPQISAVSVPHHHELDDMREQYANDEDFARVFEQLMDGQRHEHYLLKDGFMMMHGRLCVTRPLRRKVMEESHVPPYAGHRDLPIIKEVLENAGVLKGKNKMHRVEDLYVATYELLFGKELVATGNIEEYVLARKSALRAGLARLLVKKNVSSAEDLLPATNGPRVRYVRVNTLKMEVDTALEMLRETLQVEVDDLVPGLVTVPANVDLHTHPLVLNGSLILQGKASCIPALALAPGVDWMVLDACAAPGNKTAQLAALMKGKGQIFACELNKNRIKRLYEIVKLAGASNVKVMHQDFLKLDVNDPSLSQVKGIILDPSCSGSGTVYRRLDHLLPSFANNQEPGGVDSQRLQKLANFQKTALRFALSFPAVERVVYSTCSVHQQENEEVVRSVLDFARNNGFQLGRPIPQWQQRGLPVFEGASNLLRVKPSEEMDGFFVALFERNAVETVSADLLLRNHNQETDKLVSSTGRKEGSKRKRKHKKKRLA
ncbi:hypothetical protein L7F22_011277 [Adiantum nelumboides]|nr:hypothetical protein [Adiantum nelumboides]